MPYIAIKAYPKDEATKKEIVERINQAFLEVWGCSQEAINISIEEVAPQEWDEKVMQKEVVPQKDKMMIYEGQKNY